MKWGSTNVLLVPQSKRDRPRWYDRTKYMNAQEVTTDGLMIKNTAIRAVDKHLNRQHRYAIGVTYRIRAFRTALNGHIVPDTLSLLKDWELESLADYMRLADPALANKWYTVWVLRKYLGDKPPKHQTDEFWSDNFNKSIRTLRRWRNDKIIPIYKRLYGEAYNIISIKLHHEGLIIA